MVVEMVVEMVGANTIPICHSLETVPPDRGFNVGPGCRGLLRRELTTKGWSLGPLTPAHSSLSALLRFWLRLFEILIKIRRPKILITLTNRFDSAE